MNCALKQDEFDTQPPHPSVGGAFWGELPSFREPNRNHLSGSQDRSMASTAIATISNAKPSCHISATS
ncbi:MAG: hypothetical protein JNJ76_02160 [Candidatus Competibacter sp.]|nr:hypothetical protein [Candidatus Competibacter sp.]